MEDYNANGELSTWRGRFILIGFVLQTFFNCVAYSIIGPVYPLQARSLGETQTQIGYVFSIFSFTYLIASLFFGHYGGQWGQKRVMLWGSFVEGLGLASFGICTELWQFLIIRLIQGIGTGAAQSMTYSMLSTYFPKRIGFANSLVEMAGGMGYIAGPLLGGFIYQWSGVFFVPFVATGAANLLMLACFAVVVRGPVVALSVRAENPETGPLLVAKHTKEAERHISVVNQWSLVKVPYIVHILVYCVIATMAFSVIDSTFALHLHGDGGLEQIHITYAFAILATCYSVGSPAAGVLTDRYLSHGKLIMSTGAIMVAVAGVFIALTRPFVSSVPFLRPLKAVQWLVDHELALVYCTVALAGVGFSLAMMPTLPYLLDCAKGVAQREYLFRRYTASVQSGPMTDQDDDNDHDHGPALYHTPSAASTGSSPKPGQGTPAGNATALSVGWLPTGTEEQVNVAVGGLFTTTGALGQIIGPVLATQVATAFHSTSEMYALFSLTLCGYVLLGFAVPALWRCVFGRKPIKEEQHEVIN